MFSPQLILTALPDFPLVQPGDDLAALVLEALARCHIHLQDGDVLVLASKIVSKAEGRYRDLRQVRVSPAAREVARACAKDPRLVQLILEESREVLRIRTGLIVVEHRLGFVCANAGIDHSNTAADRELVLLLPRDPDGTARALRERWRKATGADIAVVINDSHGRAWRLGTVGVAIGVAGLLPLSDRRGEGDLFGRTLEVTVLGTADELAAAASLLQGGADEGAPVIHVRGAPYRAGEGRLADLLRPRELDMFR
ncbi:MAG: coenzyme F420-0:L-glutamate ligase [Caldilineae bacterium]|nr:MAG: coenzyme F420-0:L-glutamate ligase [Caldilineae bacterium]